ncbi:MAG: beta-N-acetylhexosaminidase [Planctomycetes bacterium]|nr:beta-N-acetylhexosaminidase [Planctomycetota bacterium]
MINYQDPQCAGQRLWIGIPSTELDSATIELLQELKPGGIILFRRNIDSADQVRRLTRDLRKWAGESLHICIDQEGGRVVRFPDGITFFPGNMALGSLACSDPEVALELAFAQGWHTGMELLELGIDINLAPCIDLVASPHSRGIGSRSFGSDPQRALALASALGRGMRSAGVRDCWKHFPGLGRVTVDPHFGLPATDPEESASDLIPFGGAEEAGASIVMTSHVIARALDADLPVTISSRAVNHLRSGLKFSGVVMTDCLEMGGVSGLSPEEVAKGAMAAGHDVLLVSHTPDLQRAIHHRIEKEIEDESAPHLQSLQRISALAAATEIPADSPKPIPLLTGEEVARKICRGGVSLLQGRLPETPLTGGWSLVVPEQFSHSPVEDSRSSAELDLLAHELPMVSRTLRFDSPEQLARLASAENELMTEENLLLALQGARLDSRYREVLEALAKSLDSLVVLLLDDSRDLVAMPEADNLSVLCAHGARPLHLKTLSEVLRGEIPPGSGQPIGN